MLTKLVRTLPFIFIRILLGALDVYITIKVTLIAKDQLLLFIGPYVPSLFLFFLTPLTYIIGLGISMVICYYFVGVIAYFFKLAHIVAITSLTLGYSPSKMPLTFYAIDEARKNFMPLVVSYITTKTVVHALNDLKDTIMEFDIMSKFKEPKNTLVKLVKNISVQGIRNVIDVADEITISYTWFTNDLYRRSDKYKNNKKARTLRNRTKVQAKNMLESLVFIVRTFPYLMLSSLIYETLFIILNVVFTVSLGLYFLKVFGFTWLTVLLIFVSYRSVVQLFGYIVTSSLRNIAYLHTFYGELAEMEPFDIKSSVTSLVSSVPGLSQLAKMSGENIQATRGKGTSGLLEEDFSQVFRDSLKDTVKAFNLEESDLLITGDEEETLQNNLDSIPDAPEEIPTPVEEISKEEPEIQQQPVPRSSTSDLLNDLQNSLSTLGEIDLNIDDSSKPGTGSPFDNPPPSRRR